MPADCPCVNGAARVNIHQRNNPDPITAYPPSGHDWSDVANEQPGTLVELDPQAREAARAQRLANRLITQREEEYVRIRARAEAQERYNAEMMSKAQNERSRVFGHSIATGGAFLFDQPVEATALWGEGKDVLWARGESLMIAGPQGVGKTTLIGQLLRALLGVQDSVLGFPVAPAEKKILYLAMDRPQQAQRNLQRMFAGLDEMRDYFDEMLIVRPGPPPADFAANPEILAEVTNLHDAGTVLIDSMKDAAVGLSKDEVGAGYNRARQIALAEGLQVAELHHTVKNGADGGKPNHINGVYGSTWLTSGAGSVVMLWGDPGAAEVEFLHLKQPMENVGPFRVYHDNTTGEMTRIVEEQRDLLAMLRKVKYGLTKADAAMIVSEVPSTRAPSRAELATALRKLTALVNKGLAVKVAAEGSGRGQVDRWFAAEQGASAQAA